MDTDHTQILKKYGYRKLRRVSDSSTNESVDEIFIPTGHGDGLCRWFRPSEIAKTSDFRGTLQNLDARLPDSSTDLRLLLAALLQAEPQRHQFSLSHEGWTDDLQHFGRAGSVIGKDVGALVGTQLGLRQRGQAGSLGTRGSVESWSASQGAIAATSSTILLAVSAAFAAPLLRLMNESSFSLCFVGPSRTFKSVATLISGSFIGISKQSEMCTWSITDANLYEVLPSYNDMLFPIDDLTAMEASERDQFRRIEKVAYDVASGQEKGRHSTFQAQRGKWQSIMLTQSEYSIASLAERVGQVRKRGSALRLIDVPVVLGSAGDIFDGVEGTDAIARNAWREEKYCEIVRSCERSHGAAFDAYVSWLIKPDSRAVKRSTAHVAKFVEVVRQAQDDAQVADLSRKFGLLYAGAMMGIGAGVVAWDRTTALEAIVRCYRGACSIFRLHDIAEAAAKLREFVKRLPLRKDNVDYDSVAGFRTIGMGKPTFVIKSESLAQLLGPKSRDALLSDLAERNMILMGTSRHSGKRVPRGQPMWPDGERRRSITIIGHAKDI